LWTGYNGPVSTVLGRGCPHQSTSTSISIGPGKGLVVHHWLALVAVGLSAALFIAVWALTRGGIGLADVKFAVLIGAALGLPGAYSAQSRVTDGLAASQLSQAKGAVGYSLMPGRCLLCRDET